MGACRTWIRGVSRGECNLHDWPEFQRLVRLTWEVGKTAHGAYHPFKVTVRDGNHPITRGMRDFWIADELWHNMASLSGGPIQVLCAAFSEPDFGGTGKFEPVVVPGKLGQGRGLNIVLGDNVQSLQNVAWRTLMLRGLEWAATGNTTLPIPDNWPHTAAAAVVTGHDLATTIRRVAAYHDGQAAEPLRIVAQWAAVANSLPGAESENARGDLAQRLAVLLSEDTAPEVKAFVCDRLAEIGGDKQVPAIANYLGDERVSFHARGALMRIHSAAALQALRNALDSTHDLARVGIIYSLGQLRDRQSIATLAPLLADNDPQVAAAAALALGQIGTVACADRLIAAAAREISTAAIGQALVICADRMLAEGNQTEARTVYETLNKRSAALPIRLAALRGLARCGSEKVIATALFDEDRRLQALGMKLLRESLGPENTTESMIAWFKAMLELTEDVERRKMIVTQLQRAPEVATLQLTENVMHNDPAIREAAAAAAARIGTALANREREAVKSAMQRVIAVSHVAETVKLADLALREAARSANLALQAAVSSPDGLEPDGGSGPDAAAVDGNPATYWDETDSQSLYRFKISFARPTSVNTVIIRGHAYQSHSPKDFDVLCDDQVVVNVIDAQYDERTNETQIAFPRCECSSLELRITGYYGGSPGIRELEVYDIDTRVQPTTFVPLPAGPRKLTWQSEDNSLTLLNHSRIVWTLHFGDDSAKPYFSPLGLMNGTSLVWNSPPDHPWHHGLWFSWKEINGVNYWEEDTSSGRSDGRTEVMSVKVTTQQDFSACVELQIGYHKPDEPVLLREKRLLNISAPDEDGSYFIDWRSTFEASEQDLVLRGGTAGGGYAGLSVRTAPDTRDWRLVNSEGGKDTPGVDPLPQHLHGKHASWMDFGLVHSGSGQPAGITIFEHPTSLRYPTQWHCVLEDKIPFGYFSPSPLWSEPYTLKAGGQFPLAYRILIHPTRLSVTDLEIHWQDYAGARR